MQYRTLVENGSMLSVKFTVSKTINLSSTAAAFPPEKSKQYVVGGAAFFQVQIVDNVPSNSQVAHYIFVSFHKQLPEDGLTYTMQLKCPEFNISDKYFTTDDGTWHLLHHKLSSERRIQNNNILVTCNFSFSIALTMGVISKGIINAPLHEDSNLTDFELRGTDGSVPIHKAVLAAASPVFNKMLTGPWEEVKNGYVDLGVKKTVLDNLKNYLYLGTLPDSGSEEIILLASRYMMPELEQMCVFKLVQHLTAVNAWDILEIAMTNKVTRLGLAIMEAVQNGLVPVVDIKKNVLLKSYPNDA